MNDQETMSDLEDFINARLTELGDIPQGRRIENTVINWQAVLSAYKALSTSEMAFKVELAEIGLRSGSDEEWMGRMIKSYWHERPFSVKPFMERSKSVPPPLPAKKEKTALPGFIETISEIRSMLGSNPQFAPAKMLISVAGVITKNANDTDHPRSASAAPLYTDLLEALGQMKVGPTIREDIGEILDDFVASRRKNVEPERVTSVPPPTPLTRAKSVAARVFQSLSVDLKLQVHDISDSVLDEYAASEGLDEVYERDKFKAELTGLIRSFKEQTEQSGIDTIKVGQAVGSYWGALDDKNRARVLGLTAAAASAAAKAQGLTNPLDVSAFVTEITRKSRQFAKIREAAERVWQEARPKDNATIDDLMDLANSQGFIPADEAYAFVDAIGVLKRNEALLEKDAIVENILTAAWDSKLLEDDDREGLETAIVEYYELLERAYQEPIHQEKVSALQKAGLNERQIRAVLESMEGISPTLEMDQSDGHSEITRARLQAMIVWQRELSDEDKRSLTSGEMGLKDQLDLAERHGIFGNDNQYAFVRKLDELSRSVDKSGNTNKPLPNKGKPAATPTVKAKEIAEGLWEKATDKERLELALMEEDRLLEMAFMFGIRGSARYAFSDAISALSKTIDTDDDDA